MYVEPVDSHKKEKIGKKKEKERKVIGMADGMNMVSVTIKEFLRCIREQIEDEDFTPILALGKSGIGKTECVGELCKELKIGYKEIRLINHTETDLIGLPYMTKPSDGNEETGTRTTRYAQNNLLPYADKDGECGILALDEITSAPINLRTIAYQLLDKSRGVGDYKLPPKWLVIVLGNGVEDGGNYQGIEGAVLNRCNSMRVEPNTSVWISWAIRHRVNTSVIAYIQHTPDHLHMLDPNADVCVFPSPRSWTNLAKKLDSREKKAEGGILDEESVRLYSAAAVGMDLAPSFASFYKYNSDLIDVDDIISGKKKNATDKEMGIQASYMLMQSIIGRCQLLCDSNSERKLADRMKDVVAIVKFVINVGENNHLGWAVELFQSLGRDVPAFANIACEEEFDEICPEYLAFASKHQNIFA